MCEIIWKSTGKSGFTDAFLSLSESASPHKEDLCRVRVVTTHNTTVEQMSNKTNEYLVALGG